MEEGGGADFSGREGGGQKERKKGGKWDGELGVDSEVGVQKSEIVHDRTRAEGHIEMRVRTV